MRYCTYFHIKFSKYYPKYSYSLLFQEEHYLALDLLADLQFFSLLKDSILLFRGYNFLTIVWQYLIGIRYFIRIMRISDQIIILKFKLHSFVVE